MLSMICKVARSASDRFICLLARTAENIDAKAAVLSVISGEAMAMSPCQLFTNAAQFLQDKLDLLDTMNLTEVGVDHEHAA
jgi:hypothetical protein